MLKRLTKNLCIPLLIIPILISLSSLGMRLPSIDGISSGGPKPRPRAVIQTQISKCKQAIAQQAPACTIVTWRHKTPQSLPQPLQEPRQASHYLFVCSSPGDSRAPPLAVISA